MNVTRYRLVEPAVEFERSHGSFLQEFRDLGERVVPWIVEEPCGTFAGYVEMLHQLALGVGLPEGFVPCSTYWLLDSAGEIVAVSNLRHALTERSLDYGGHIGYGVRPSARGRGLGVEVLRRTLDEARRLGITRVRLTCDKENVASAKTIRRNGGKLDEEAYMAEHGCVVQRYWIEL